MPSIVSNEQFVERVFKNFDDLSADLKQFRIELNTLRTDLETHLEIEKDKIQSKHKRFYYLMALLAGSISVIEAVRLLLTD